MANVIFPRKTSETTVNTGDFTIETTPPEDKATTPAGNTSTSNVVIPAGAVYVRIMNLGGLAPAVATINGTISLVPNSEFERYVHTDGVNRYTLPQYTIVTNGSLVEYYYETA